MITRLGPSNWAMTAPVPSARNPARAARGLSEDGPLHALPVDGDVVRECQSMGP